MDCVLCGVLLNAPDALITRLAPRSVIPTEAVAVSPEFTLTCDIAPIVPGYALLISNRHVSSRMNLSRAAQDEYLEIEDWLISVMSSNLGQVVALEHGGGIQSGRSSQCIDHAHVHFVPVSRSPRWQASRMVEFEASDPELLQSPPVEYLYCRDDQGTFLATGVDPPSQFWRMLIATDAGTALPWDWRLYQSVTLKPLSLQRIIELREFLQKKIHGAADCPLQLPDERHEI